MPEHAIPASSDADATREEKRLTPLHVVMIALVTAIVAGGSLLLSAETGRHMEGAIEWHAESPLRALVALLCLNYQLPTPAPGEIKNYVLGIGAGLGLIALCIAIAVRDPSAQAVEEPSPPSDQESGTGAAPRESKRAHIAPLLAAQVMFGLYVLWSFASSRWSPAPDLAIGGSVLLAIQAVWALSLGNALSVPAVRIVSRILVAAAAITAVVAVWYYYGRNPVLRAMFPFGNPNFLSAALTPGIILGVAWIVERLRHHGNRTRPRSIGLVVAIAVALAMCHWAFYLAGSRGPAAGLLFGLLAVWFFAARGRWKLPPALLALILAIGGWVYMGYAASAPSPTGRDATLRFRTYAWDYAWRMFLERPYTGHGQGGFALQGDSYAINDVLDDPLVFGTRIAHAHSEWLEVLADLGSVGIVLVGAALLLTLRAGMLARESLPHREDRWVQIGLMGALVALCVEESAGVGLRVTGVPTWFYTVLGLNWACASYGTRGLADQLSATRPRRVTTGIIGVAAGLSVLVVTQRDWRGARHAYLAEAAFRDGDYDEAIRHAELSTFRLSPQRALVNMFQLCEAHLVRAQVLQSRAFDRERRGRATEPPNLRLLAMAEEDYRYGNAHCKAASHELKEVVSRSRGLINQGRLEYAINLTRARNAEAYARLASAIPADEPAQEKNDYLSIRDQFLKYAADALKRELLRQPFDPQITLEYIAIADLTFEEIIHLLARPLRHNRMPREYVEVLGSLAAQPPFREHFGPLVEAARRAVAGEPPRDESGIPLEIWAPETLRLAAAVAFMQGNREAACGQLRLATQGYDSLPAGAPLGTAAAYAELADCLFFRDPLEVEPALAAARAAIERAPQSRLGRELQADVEQRMVDYFLASDQEEEARRLLASSAPREATDEMIREELGRRYARLGLSLHRRSLAMETEAPDSQLFPLLHRVARRAMELSPDDAEVFALAAAMAIEDGDDAAAADHLRRALAAGLPPEQADVILSLGLERQPESEGLRKLREELSGNRPTPEDDEPARQPAAPAPEE